MLLPALTQTVSIFIHMIFFFLILFVFCRNREQRKKANQSSKSPPSTRTKRSSRPTMADELPTEVTRMVLTVLFERFDRNSDENIDVDEFQRLISSCNARRCKRRRPKKEDVSGLT